MHGGASSTGCLIVATIVVNYRFGRRIQELAERQAAAAKPLLAVAIAVNVGLLGYFKYRNFFIDNLNTVTGSDWALVPLVLPLAISFHTFQQIAYLVDCYRRKVEQPRLLSYSLFVLFFPQLVAGPIVHHYQMLPQLRDKRIYTFDYGSLATGLCFFVFGLAKKLLIADPLSFISDRIFDGALIRSPSAGTNLDRPLRLHACYLFRLLRLFRHGGRSCSHVRNQAALQFRFAL